MAVWEGENPPSPYWLGFQASHEATMGLLMDSLAQTSFRSNVRYLSSEGRRRGGAPVRSS